MRRARKNKGDVFECLFCCFFVMMESDGSGTEALFVCFIFTTSTWPVFSSWTTYSQDSMLTRAIRSQKWCSAWSQEPRVLTISGQASAVQADVSCAHKRAVLHCWFEVAESIDDLGTFAGGHINSFPLPLPLPRCSLFSDLC